MPPKKSKAAKKSSTGDGSDDEFMGYTEPEEAEKSDVEDEDDDVSTVNSDLDTNSVALEEEEAEEDDVEEEEEEDAEEEGRVSDDEDMDAFHTKIRKSSLDDNEGGLMDADDEMDNVDEEDDEYYQKLRGQSKIIQDAYHPELVAHSIDEVRVLSLVVRDRNGTIIDANHRTLPFLTKYEKARVLGERTQQLERGAPTFLAELDARIIKSNLIATMELEQRKIPFIIQRPMPNGKCEFWPLKELEII
jgi:DNA-directed RNA polymerase subunit K/omega